MREYANHTTGMVMLVNALLDDGAALNSAEPTRLSRERVSTSSSRPARNQTTRVRWHLGEVTITDCQPILFHIVYTLVYTSTQNVRLSSTR